MIVEILKASIKEALATIAPQAKAEIHLEHPGDFAHGDYSTNVALSLAKELKMSPVALAVEIVAKIMASKPEELTKAEVAGPGFINFYLAPAFFTQEVEKIVSAKEQFGRNDLLKGKKVVIDYTDPNPFKQFHIGHLMSNAIGEAVSRMKEWSGAEVKRVCYQGDVGRHVALTIWGLRQMGEPFPEDSASLSEKVAYLGKAYALGATALKDDPKLAPEIQKINKEIYDRSDKEVNEVYDKGKEWSLSHFEEIYTKLGTNFDDYIFESLVSPLGAQIVDENIKNGIFEKSEGAVVFPGEKHGLHTRVFLTKENLPTYEAKDLGLAKIKYELFPFDTSIIVTASEQSDYFKVVLKVIELVMPEIAKTMQHVSHGMLRLPSGKMSSRTGDVIPGDALIAEAERKVEEKVKDRNYPEDLKKEIVTKVAVAAIKYSILKQSPGKDIIFDFDNAISFEGDSGPYLQYSYVRAKSVLEKAKEQNISHAATLPAFGGTELEKILHRFPEIVEEAMNNNAPQQIITYLLALSAAFNSFYASNKILDGGDAASYRLSLTEAFATVLKNGLTIVGIPVPEKM